MGWSAHSILTGRLFNGILVPMRKYLALLATLAVLAVNAAANILPINGVNTGEVSARYPTGFTPAGWVFSIWGVIYLGLIAFAVFATRVQAGRADRVRSIEPAYLVSCLANATWIFMWHFGRILESLLLMLLLLGSLLVVYLRLRAAPAATVSERICVDLPLQPVLRLDHHSDTCQLGGLVLRTGRLPVCIADG